MTGRPLLVVVDMQRVFAEPGRPWCAPGYEGIVEPVDRLVRVFGDRVVFTRYILPDRPEGSWVPYLEVWNAVTGPEAEPLFELTEPWGTRHPPTLDKSMIGKWGPELRDVVGKARTLVLCGVTTDCCVIATAIPAADAGMFVRVVSEACTGSTEAAHRRALDICRGFEPQITITTAEEELAGLAADGRT